MCLLCSRRLCGKEVIAANLKTCSFCIAIVLFVIRVLQAFSLGTLQINETDGIVNAPCYLFLTDFPQANNAQLMPFNTIVFLSNDVLIFGDINAINTVIGVVAYILMWAFLQWIIPGGVF